jgi:hypothetical protein
MTTEEAIKLHESRFWEPMSFFDRAMFQLWENKLCMPFSVFHEAVEKALNRSVWTHEFALNREGLKAELLGLRPAPSFDDIVNLIPEEKRVVLFAGGSK